MTKKIVKTTEPITMVELKKTLFEKKTIANATLIDKKLRRVNLEFSEGYEDGEIEEIASITLQTLNNL